MNGYRESFEQVKRERPAEVHFWQANTDPYPSDRIAAMQAIGYRYHGASGCGAGAFYDFSRID